MKLREDYDILEKELIGNCSVGACFVILVPVVFLFDRNFLIGIISVVIGIVVGNLVGRELMHIPYFTSLRYSKICKFYNNGRTIRFRNIEYQRQFDLLNPDLAIEENRQDNRDQIQKEEENFPVSKTFTISNFKFSNQRLEVYKNFIEQMSACKSINEMQLQLQANTEIVDVDLIEAMHYLAQQSGREDIASSYKDIENNIIHCLSRDSEGLVDFLKEVVVKKCINETPSKEVIYPLLAINTDKLIPAFGIILKNSFTHMISRTPKQAIYIAIGILKFGTLLLEFPTYNHTTNIELSIVTYKLALDVFNRHDFPEEWALTQFYLANAYEKRIRGDRAENIENSIAAYKLALEVYKRSDFPIEWAMTQNNLGLTYYSDYIRGDRAQNLEDAINAYKLSLEVYTRHNFSEEWAGLQNSLAVAYWERIRGNRAQNLEDAISAFKLALEVRTRHDFPEKWAITQNNLALTYSDRIRGDGAQNLEDAIAAFKLALEVRTRHDFSEDWALTQNNLARTYCLRIRGDRAQNLEDAIATYKLALEVRTRHDFPIDWALTQHNLAIAYIDRIRGDRAQNLEDAIAAFKLALEVRTRHDFPIDWASTQNSLANAYINRIRGDRAQNLEDAIAAFKLALEVRTRHDFPIDWAMVQNNLASAYCKNIHGDRAQNLEDAIGAYKLALQVWTQHDFPTDWAMAQHNLAVVYGDRIHGDQAQNLEDAITAYQLVLQIWTQHDFPIDWAMTQYNLANAYCKNIRGDREQNLKDAIATYKRALAVYTPENFPDSCLITSNNLGNLGFFNHLSNIAIEGYTIAITAVENLRYEAIDPNRREEILSNAIEVYANLIQVYVDRGEYDKAIEICDRSKARNLVELLTTRDLYPQGDIPPEVIAELDRLRGAIATAERQLNQSGNDSQQFLSDIDRDIRTVNARTLRAQADAAARDRLVQLKQELDTLIQTEIQPQDPAFSLTQKVQPLTFEQLRDTIPSDKTVILSWYIAGNKLIAFLISRNSEQPTLFLYPDDALEQLNPLVNDYIEGYRNQKQVWRNRLPDLLQQFSNILQSDRLLQTIFQLQPNCDRLILIPHRFLHILPLHAMPVSSSGKYLLDSFPNGISFAPSLQVLGLTQQRQKTDLDNLLAIQNPTEDLPFTDFEVGIIRRFFTPNDTVLVHTAATTESLRNSQIERSHCLHFACHGYFNFAQPERSALLFAGSQTESSINESNCLTLLDLFQLNLQKCGLVALSACETGLTNFDSQSDEFVGLPSGFLFAGSPSVISSLWTVDDLATSLLMVSFYRYYKEDRLPPALALKQAQNDLRLPKVELIALVNRLNLDSEARICLDLNIRKLSEDNRHLNFDGDANARFDLDNHKLSDDDRPYASPFYWAAFQVIGQ